MNDKEIYLNLLDVLSFLYTDSYEYETLENVMSNVYEKLSDKEKKEIDKIES